MGSNPTYEQIMQGIQQVKEEAEALGGTWGTEIGGEFDDEYVASISMNYRKYNETERLIVLKEETQNLVVCYLDANRNLVSAETLVCTVKYASSTRQISNVKQSKIASRDVTPNAENRKDFSYTLKNGQLVSTIEDTEAVDLSKVNKLQTRVKVPQETVKIVTRNWWGQIEGQTYTPSRDGYFTISTTFKYTNRWESNRNYNNSYAFLDADGNILPGGGLLWITVINAQENRLALHFLEDETWRPIPSDHFRATIRGANGLVRAEYQDALVHISANKQGRVTEGDARRLPGAQKSYQVQAPAGAKSYRIGATGGFGVFGAGNAQNLVRFLNFELAQSPLRPVQGGQWVDAMPVEDWDENVFKWFVKSKNGSDLYTVNTQTTSGHAMLYAVEWFSDAAGKESMGVWWYGENADDLTLRAQTYTVPSNDHVTRPLDGPAVVCRQNGLTLYAEYRAQSGDNADVIDLKLLDEDGDPITDFAPYTEDGTLEFFIPYPEGQSVSSNNTYSVTHYLSADLSSNEPALEMHCEVGGIRFRVRSLSPIELSWQSQDAPAQTILPPKTGDSSHRALWLVLCLVSLTAMAVLLSRRRKA